jgi:hypothetical protein
MSGSPVFHPTSGPFSYKDGKQVVNARVRVDFLGVYAGRIHDAAETGQVWRADAVREMLDQPTAPVV